MVESRRASGSDTSASTTSTQSASQPTRLPRLTSLRAFAAFYVFTDHLALFNILGHGQLPMRIGFSAVCFFFIISGFVLTWGASEMAATSFYRRRLARIYPSYLFVLIVAMLVPVNVGNGPVDAKTGAITAGLVQSWAIHNPNTPFAVNGVSWSLSCEAFFYLAFPLLVRLFIRLRPMWRWGLALGWWALCSIYVLHGGQHDFPVDYTNPIVRSSEFIVGIVAALEVRRGWRLPPWAAVLIGAGALGGTAVVSKAIPSPNVPMAPLFFVIVIMCAQLDLSRDHGLLRTKWLVYAGEVSYCFYLVQLVIILNLRSAVGTGPWAALALLAVASASAVVLHHTIERPCQRLILGQWPVPVLRWRT